MELKPINFLDGSNMNNPLLDIHNLSVKNLDTGEYYLKNISFKLYGAEKLCIFGDSGSGKSLLCKSLLGLHAVNLKQSGSITYRENDRLYDLTDRNTLGKIRGKTIALMFQNIFSSLNPMLKIERQFNLISSKNRACELLKKVGFASPVKIMQQYPNELSGGELTRLGLAMVAAQQPKIIILDEAFRSIHVELQELFINHLNSLVSHENVSLIIVTHNVAIMQQFANRIILLKKGEIIDKTTPCQFFDSPKTEYGKSILKAYKDIYL